MREILLSPVLNFRKLSQGSQETTMVLIEENLVVALFFSFLLFDFYGNLYLWGCCVYRGYKPAFVSGHISKWETAGGYRCLGRGFISYWMSCRCFMIFWRHVLGEAAFTLEVTVSGWTIPSQRKVLLKKALESMWETVILIEFMSVTRLILCTEVSSIGDGPLLWLLY